MMLNRLTLLTASLALGAGSAQAATITVAGADIGAGPTWRTPSDIKPLDADGDNIYGTDGYVKFQTGFTGSTFRFSTNPFSDASQSFPSYATVTTDGATGSVTAPNFADIDNPASTSATPPDFNSGVASRSNFTTQGLEVSLFNINFNASAPATGVRVGVYTNNAFDRNPMAIRLTADSNALVTASQLTGTGVSSRSDYYFFDITNIGAGETFSFFATEDTGDTNTAGEVRVGGFTFDTLPIPEPASAAILALGGLMLLPRRQRA